MIARLPQAGRPGPVRLVWLPEDLLWPRGAAGGAALRDGRRHHLHPHGDGHGAPLLDRENFSSYFWILQKLCDTICTPQGPRTRLWRGSGGGRARGSWWGTSSGPQVCWPFIIRFLDTTITSHSDRYGSSGPYSSPDYTELDMNYMYLDFKSPEFPPAAGYATYDRDLGAKYPICQMPYIWKLKIPLWHSLYWSIRCTLLLRLWEYNLFRNFVFHLDNIIELMLRLSIDW